MTNYETHLSFPFLHTAKVNLDSARRERSLDFSLIPPQESYAEFMSALGTLRLAKPKSQKEGEKYIHFTRVSYNISTLVI